MTRRLPAFAAFALHATAQAAPVALTGGTTCEPTATYDLAHLDRIGWSEAAKVLPGHTADLLTPAFAAQNSLVANRFYRHLFENHAYRWRSVTPARCYYGEADEVTPPYIATLPVGYEKAIGGTETTAISASEKADHRGAFVFGLVDQKKWFDSLLK